MTGYGEGRAEVAGLRVMVALRGVNHRFTDLRLRIPAEWLSIEPEVRRQVLARVRRGRVEIVLSVERAELGPSLARLNRPMAEAVAVAARTLQVELGVTGQLDLKTLLALPGILQTAEAAGPPDAAAREAVESALCQALEAFEGERRREGESLVEDLAVRVGRMKELVESVRARAGELPEIAHRRLSERVKGLVQGVIEVDAARLAQEVAFLADRSDVTEELVRLAGHLVQASSLLGRPDGEPVGKRLDFLLQEIHRETNTIQSKSADLQDSRLTLDLKAEAERVREQVQNLE